LAAIELSLDDELAAMHGAEVSAEITFVLVTIGCVLLFVAGGEIRIFQNNNCGR